MLLRSDTQPASVVAALRKESLFPPLLTESRWNDAPLPLRQAYAHGTCALRTHLMSGRYQAQFSWCAVGPRSCPAPPPQPRGQRGAPPQRALTRARPPRASARPAFAKLRDKWKGRVELQGVALVVLAYFRWAAIAPST